MRASTLIETDVQRHSAAVRFHFSSAAGHV
jgi:hypothetical protein